MNSEEKSPSILKIPKVIWADNIDGEIQLELDNSTRLLAHVTDILSQTKIGENSEETYDFVGEIDKCRQYLNFIDQKLEILSDLSQYLINERSKKDGDVNQGN